VCLFADVGCRVADGSGVGVVTTWLKKKLLYVECVQQRRDERN